MRVYFEKNPLIVQSDIGILTVNILKDEDDEARFKVKAVGTSQALEYKYRNRAIAGETGDFFFEEQIVSMGYEENLKRIDIQIYNTERVKEGAKYFTLKLINLDENYEFAPNSICHCYLVDDIKKYLSDNIDRYNLPLSKIVNYTIESKKEKEGEEEVGGGGGSLQKVPLKGRLFLKTNDEEELYNEFPILIYEKFLYDLYEFTRAIESSEDDLYKVLLLTQYTPGATYEFNYKLGEELDHSSDITVHLLDMDILLFLKIAYLNYGAQEDWYSEKDYIDAIGRVKNKSFMTKIKQTLTEGTFKITPTPSRKILCFSARDYNYEPDGIAFKYDRSTQTIELRSF